MKRRILMGLSVLMVSLLSSQSAFALISAEGAYGWRQFEASDSDQTNKGNALKAAVHLDPIPLIPISFGLGLTSFTLGFEGAPDAEGYELGFEVKAWLPFVPIITPYVRMNYVALGKMTQDGLLAQGGGLLPYKAVYDLSGLLYGVGAEWSPLPLLGIFAEVQMGTLKAKPSEIKLAGVDASANVTAVDFGVRDIFLGVSLGI